MQQGVKTRMREKVGYSGLSDCPFVSFRPSGLSGFAARVFQIYFFSVHSSLPPASLLVCGPPTVCAEEGRPFLPVLLLPLAVSRFMAVGLPLARPASTSVRPWRWRPPSLPCRPSSAPRPAIPRSCFPFQNHFLMFAASADSCLLPWSVVFKFPLVFPFPLVALLRRGSAGWCHGRLSFLVDFQARPVLPAQVVR